MRSEVQQDLHTNVCKVGVGCSQNVLRMQLHVQYLHSTHFSVITKWTICHSPVTIYPIKVRVPPMMTGAMKMTSVVICVFVESLVEHINEIVP